MLGFTKFKINRLVNRRELYSNFSYNKWNQLDTGSKWKCLQQLENHFAAEQGRPAVKVLPISSKEVRGDYGGYDPDKNVIYINRDLVEYGTLVGPVDINHPTQLDANMQLFDTIAHEGYHAYQGYAIKHPGFHKDMKQVKEWAINDRNVKYFRRGDEYLVQPRERDAWKYGSEKTREAFDEIEKYYGTEPGRAMYEKSVEDNSYENALERLWNNNPDALNQMYKEMMDAYEERYWENNSTVNLDPITVDEYDAISREAVNRYYEHLKNNPSLSNEDVMRMTGDMSEKYFSAVEEYKNAVQQKEKSEDRGEKENRTEKYEAQNPENRSIFNPDRVSVEEYDKTLRDQVNKYYEHLKNDPSLSNEDVMRMTEEMSEKYLTAVEEYRNAQKQEDEGFQEKSGDKESTEKRYKKEEIEKENPEHKRDVENQRKEEVEEENKSEKKDKLENREDEKDYEEEGAENKDKTETLSEDELEEERWNESESEDEAELLSDKAEAGEEQNAEDKAVTETESELQDNAADLSSEESSGETEDNSETEDNVEDLSSEESSEETEDESEKEDKDEDLSSEEGTEETEDESEKEDKAENLSGEESSEETEDESEKEDEAEDLSSGEGTEETEDESEKEDKAEDLSGEESSEETEDESEEEDKAEDLSSEKSSGGIEDNSEEEDKAEDLSGEESSGKIEDESEEEDEAKDLSSEENSGETEDNSEEEDKAEDLSSGEDDSTSYESGGNEEDENYSY